ncbi:MAG: hypothetical protein KKA10_17805 [Euryarchaeota archaeon]|nr:hypothetical protein [Euryarchaeota archaeon]MCG2734833.1 hypothetical protein [Candidatus Methanoperedenaceae archaeon]
MKKILFVFCLLILSIITASAAENITIPSASVELHGEKTDVVLGEDIILKLSAVKFINKPVMTVQVILIPPSGMSVTSSEFVNSGAGQFTSTYNISTGDVRDIEVKIKTQQAGDFEVKARVMYYFGNDKSTAEYLELSLPIKVRTPPPTPVDVRTPIEKTTGLSKNTLIILGILALLLILIIYRSWKKSVQAEALISASVQLYGEKTDVVMGEDIVLKLSAVNVITKPAMTVQVIIIPPSGMSVTSSGFVTSGAGQYTTTYTVDPGAGKDLEVRIKPNQPGDFEVKGRVVYYFGKDKGTTKDQPLTLPVKVRPGENEFERAGRLGVADVRSKHAVKNEVLDFQRLQKIKDAETDILIEQKQNEMDFEEAKQGIEALRLLKQAKAEAKKGYAGVDRVVTVTPGMRGADADAQLRGLEQIDIEINNAVKKSIKSTIEEARFFFKDESVIHGFFRNELKKHFRESALLKDNEDLILEECKTKLCYQRETGTDHGIPYGSPEYNDLRRRGYQPKSAYFDFAIWNPGKEVYDEGRESVPKALIGIEVKRQKEADKKEDFIEAVVKDCKKLADAGNEIRYKYLVIIMYYPDIFTIDLNNDFGSSIGDINVAYCAINKDAKQISHQEYFPNNW